MGALRRRRTWGLAALTALAALAALVALLAPRAGEGARVLERELAPGAAPEPLTGNGRKARGHAGGGSPARRGRTERAKEESTRPDARGGGDPGSVVDLGRPSAPGQVGIPALVPAAVPRSGPGASPREAPEGGEGLRNRGGAELDAVAAQLSQELMPLVDECIDLARARDPELSGYLSVALDIVPGAPGRALVSEVRPQEAHDLDDAELFVCLRESALSVEGLEEPRSVSLTIPIEATDGE